jgi:uncharacterized protein YjaZ
MTDEREEISAEDFQVRIAQTGIEAETFERSLLGQHIFGMIDHEIEVLREKLEAANPRDVTLNVELRDELAMRKKFKDWVRGAIQSGNNAVKDLQELEAASR